tara:strand:- start:2056 stop:2436 length:381 start_codon:yes stop_codon:yes gene_type:complete
MNIDDLTVGQLKQIAAMAGSLGCPESAADHPLIGRQVLVRDNRAGIHCGELVAMDLTAHTAVLRGARKVWHWRGAASCHGIAVRGVKGGSKVGPVVERVESCDVIEVVAMSDEAADCIRGFEEWRP